MECCDLEDSFNLLSMVLCLWYRFVLLFPLWENLFCASIPLGVFVGHVSFPTSIGVPWGVPSGVFVGFSIIIPVEFSVRFPVSAPDYAAVMVDLVVGTFVGASFLYYEVWGIWVILCVGFVIGSIFIVFLTGNLCPCVGVRAQSWPLVVVTFGILVSVGVGVVRFSVPVVPLFFHPWVGVVVSILGFFDRVVVPLKGWHIPTDFFLALVV